MWQATGCVMRRAMLGGVDETEFELKGMGRGGGVAEKVWRRRYGGVLDGSITLQELIVGQP